jgi:hypothetical protein
MHVTFFVGYILCPSPCILPDDPWYCSLSSAVSIYNADKDYRDIAIQVPGPPPTQREARSHYGSAQNKHGRSSHEEQPWRERSTGSRVDLKPSHPSPLVRLFFTPPVPYDPPGYSVTSSTGNEESTDSTLSSCFDLNVQPVPGTPAYFIGNKVFTTHSREDVRMARAKAAAAEAKAAVSAVYATEAMLLQRGAERTKRANEPKSISLPSEDRATSQRIFWI